MAGKPKEEGVPGFTSPYPAGPATCLAEFLPDEQSKVRYLAENLLFDGARYRADEALSEAMRRVNEVRRLHGLFREQRARDGLRLPVPKQAEGTKP